MPSDLDLVRQAQAGDSDAFGELVERNRRAVFRAALAAVGNAAEADDVAQETFVTAYRKLAGFRAESAFRTWLLSIAWRKALFNEFTEAELTESRRRVVFATHVLERHLAAHTWIAGDTYSLGDVNGFNLGYALPLSQPTECNDEKTPHIMEWLRRIYERPAVRQTWAKGRTPLAGRIALLERQPAATPGGAS